MPPVLRALLVTAAATGAYALLLSAVRLSPPPRPRTIEIEADELSVEEQRALVSELDAQL